MHPLTNQRSYPTRLPRLHRPRVVSRVFSSYWATCLADAPPVEWRSLYSPLSKREQGKLSLWVDILRAERAKQLPPFDISLAPEQKWELRVICWAAMDCPTNLDNFGQADWFVSCRFAECPQQTTDTHWFAKNGKASWNWRFKFPVTMSAFQRHQRLLIQLWDKDALTANDCGGEAVLDLTAPWFKRMFARRKSATCGARRAASLACACAPSHDHGASPQAQPRLATHRPPFSARPTYWYPFEEDWNTQQQDADAKILSDQQMREKLTPFSSLLDAAEEVLSRESLLAYEGDNDLEQAKFWLPLRRPQRETAKLRESDARGRVPKLLLSVQLVPQDEVERLPAGFGRSVPNSNPTLPKPTGRLKFTLNPVMMLYQLLGPKLCARLSGAVCCVLCVLLLWYLIPIVMGNVITAPITG